MFLAASISFFALLSLFPLILFLIAGAGYVFASQRPAEAFVISQTAKVLPQFVPLVRETVHEVTRTRGQVTVAGALVLMWAGTGVFDALEYALDKVWGIHGGQRLWRTKLVGIVAVSTLGLLLLLVTLALPIARSLQPTLEVLLARFGAPPFASLDALAGLAATLMTVFVLWLIYKFVPNTRVNAAQATISALFSGVMWEGAKRLFSWYLAASSNFSALYGSLGIIIGLMAWLYVLSFILLIGAELAVLSGDLRAEPESRRIGEGAKVRQ